MVNNDELWLRMVHNNSRCAPKSIHGDSVCRLIRSSHPGLSRLGLHGDLVTKFVEVAKQTSLLDVFVFFFNISRNGQSKNHWPNQRLSFINLCMIICLNHLSSLLMTL